MKSFSKEIEKGLVLGVISGVGWGWVAYTVNFLSGVFPFEHTLMYNLVIFSTAGAVFGAVAGGFMSVTQDILPFTKPFPKAVLISTSLWLILRGGAFLLSLSMPSRYHPSSSQTIQGFVLAIMLGGMLGYLWNRADRPDI